MNSRQHLLPPQTTQSRLASIDPTATHAATSASNSFAERIRLLIQRVGSATEIARMCGFSEGVVRSWRDGNSDPSRARCVTLARTLGISLVWLVAGEGAIQAEPRTGEARTIGESRENRGRDGLSTPLDDAPMAQVVDEQRLEAARAILRTDLSLSGSELDDAEHERLLGELYEIVGPGGTQIDASALLAFQQRLALRLRCDEIA
ncbi:helix-turn-helix domain-containing protein [Dyella sp. KRB-257]|uniref:helix-turn-helix domain-containing protein n=1 Tax=Dyella sp. KRB-257 TaxID=3400915 RepID=UPI003C127E52